MIRKVRFNILIVYLFCLLFSLAHAQENSKDVAASGSANPDVNGVSLDTYEDKLKYWQSLSEERRQAIRERAQKISPEQMQNLRERFDQFKKLHPAEAEKIRENFRKFKQMSPERRNALKERFQRFQSLPEERKIEIRRKIRQRLMEQGNAASNYYGQGMTDGKSELSNQNTDIKQRRQAVIKKALENRRQRLINRRRNLRR